RRRRVRRPLGKNVPEAGPFTHRSTRAIVQRHLRLNGTMARECSEPELYCPCEIGAAIRALSLTSGRRMRLARIKSETTIYSRRASPAWQSPCIAAYCIGVATFPAVVTDFRCNQPGAARSESCTKRIKRSASAREDSDSG